MNDYTGKGYTEQCTRTKFFDKTIKTARFETNRNEMTGAILATSSRWLSCLPLRWKSTSVEALFRRQSSKEVKRIVHVEKERIERGDWVVLNRWLGSIFGHEFKERALEPDPLSNRFRNSFLEVGAFRRRSPRVEVRKQEFVADEELQFSEPLLLESYSRPSIPSLPNDLSLESFGDYVFQRLEEMKKQESAFESEKGQPSSDENLKVDEEANDSESSTPPIEFRTLPFSFPVKQIERRTLMPRAWKSSGTHRSLLRNRFRKGWMMYWEHMWSQNYRHGAVTVPSSIRRFLNPSVDSSFPRESLIYVEDTELPPLINGRYKTSLATQILSFLETQPSFNINTERVGRRQNTIWAKKRRGSELWSFLNELSNEIRQGTFMFDWEKQSCRAAKLYSRRKRKSENSEENKTSGIAVFGKLPSIRERFKKELHEAHFKARTRILTSVGSSDEDAFVEDGS